LAIPESQDSRSQDRCDVDESVLVGRARSFSAVSHGQNLRKENAIVRSDGWGRFVAERGLYCLPTGQKFELTEE
jgi:hypothetical protein